MTGCRFGISGFVMFCDNIMHYYNKFFPTVRNCYFARFLRAFFIRQFGTDLLKRDVKKQSARC